VLENDSLHSVEQKNLRNTEEISLFSVRRNSPTTVGEIKMGSGSPIKGGHERKFSHPFGSPLLGFSGIQHGYTIVEP